MGRYNIRRKNMTKHLCVLLFFMSILITQACRQKNSSRSDPKSARNGIACADVAILDTSRLTNVRIVDHGIQLTEKKRHLNELNKMPTWYIDAVRPHVEIILANTGLAGFPGMEGSKGVQVRGWYKGATWDHVAGGSEANMVNGIVKVRLGNSALMNDVKSLAIHEISHGVDVSFGVTKNSKSTKALFNKLKAQPNPGERQLMYDYRFIDIREFFAMAIDEYYCNDTTRTELKTIYPDVFTYVEEKVPEILKFVVDQQRLSLAESLIQNQNNDLIP